MEHTIRESEIDLSIAPACIYNLTCSESIESCVIKIHSAFSSAVALYTCRLCSGPAPIPRTVSSPKKAPSSQLRSLYYRCVIHSIRERERERERGLSIAPACIYIYIYIIYISYLPPRITLELDRTPYHLDVIIQTPAF